MITIKTDDLKLVTHCTIEKATEREMFLGVIMIIEEMMKIKGDPLETILKLIDVYITEEEGHDVENNRS